MALSYSFHVGNKGHALTTIAKVSGASKHNLRKYKSEIYREDKIIQLLGSDNILNDVKQIYHQEFDEAVKEYNSQQSRADRKIDDYIQHVSEQKQNDVAVEIIVQIGDKDFWKNKNSLEKSEMTQVFQGQLDYLKRLCPDFKIANAVIHYDEASPHLHIIGVPVANGYKKGLNKRCAKTRIFTQQSLSDLQDKMRSMAQLQMKSCILLNYEFLKPKEQGRPFNMTKQQLTKFNQEKANRHQEINDLTNNKNSLMRQINTLQEQIDNLEKVRAKKEDEYNQEKDMWQRFTDKYMIEAIEWRDKVDLLEKKYNTINDDIKMAQNEFISLQNDIKNIKSTKLSLNVENNKIEENIKVLRKENEILNQRNIKLTNWYQENIPKIRSWQQAQQRLKSELQDILSGAIKQFHKILMLSEKESIDKDNLIELSGKVSDFYKDKISKVEEPEEEIKPLKDKANHIIEDEAEEVRNFIHRKRGR